MVSVSTGKKNPHFFLDEATADTPRHIFRKMFHVKIRTPDLPNCMLNINWNLMQKLDPTLKSSDYKQLHTICIFYA